MFRDRVVVVVEHFDGQVRWFAKLNFAKCLGHQLWRVVRVNIVRRFHPHGQLRVTLVLPLPSSRYCLKHDEYGGEQGDGYEANGDGYGCGGGNRQRNRVVLVGRRPLVAGVHLGYGRVGRGELRPRHPPLASRRAVPAPTGFRVAEAALLGLATRLLVARAAGHALIVQFVEMQGGRASGAAEFPGPGAPSTIRVAVLAEPRQGIVVLRSETFLAQAVLQHRVGGTRGALLRPLAFARATVMVTLLAAEVGLEESFGTLRVTLARRQLPTTGTGHALIPSGPGTRFARQIAFRALAPIAVIPLGARGPALSALQLQSVLARGTVQSRHTGFAGVQARHADGSGWLRHRVITVVALVHAPFRLE